MEMKFYVSYLAMSDNDNLKGVQDLLVTFPEMSGDVFGRLHPLSTLLHVWNTLPDMIACKYF